MFVPNKISGSMKPFTEKSMNFSFQDKRVNKIIQKKTFIQLFFLTISPLGRDLGGTMRNSFKKYLHGIIT